MLRLDGAVLCITLLCACTSFGAANGPGSDDADAAVAPNIGPDAGATSEAGADARPAQFCASQVAPRVVFCDDFEATASPLLSEARWTDTFPSDGDVQVVDVAGRSRALRTRVAYSDGSDRSVWIRKELTPIAKLPAERSRYRLSFRFSVTESSVTYAAIGALWFTTNEGVNLHGAALLDLGRGARPIDPSSASPAPLDAGWHDAVVVLEKHPGGWARTVTIDGTPFPAEQASELELAYQFDLRLGVYYAHGTDGIVDVQFDDVLVEAF